MHTYSHTIAKDDEIADALKEIGKTADTMLGDGGASGSAAEIEELKEEEEKEQQQLTLDSLDVWKNTKSMLISLKTMETECKVIAEEASQQSYATVLQTDLEKYIPKLRSLVNAVEKLLIGKAKLDPDFNEVKRLDDKIKDLQKKYEMMHGWAVKFDIVKKSSKRSRKA